MSLLFNNGSGYEDLPDDQLHVLKVTSFTSGVLSCLGCIFILIAPLCLLRRSASSIQAPRSISDDHADMVQAILLWLSVSDLLLSLSFTLNFSNSSTGVCVLQAALIQFSSVASFLWTAVMATELLLIVTQHHGDSRRRMLGYHFLSWTIPALITVALGAQGKLGSGSNDPFALDSYAWCWIIPEHGKWAPRFFSFYFPLMLSWAFCLVTYAKVLWTIWCTFKGVQGQQGKTQSEKSSWLLLKISLYPVIFVLTWLPALINRLQQFADDKHPVFTLWLLHALFSPSTGLFDALAYGVTNRLVRRRLYFTFLDHPVLCCPCWLLYLCCCCRKPPEASGQDQLQGRRDSGYGSRQDDALLDNRTKSGATAAHDANDAKGDQEDGGPYGSYQT